MSSVLSCIAFDHDLRLVVLAALVCAAACVGTFGCYGRSLQASAPHVRWLWIGLTGLVARFQLKDAAPGLITLKIGPDNLNLPPGVVVERVHPEAIVVRLVRHAP